MKPSQWIMILMMSSILLMLIIMTTHFSPIKTTKPPQLPKPNLKPMKWK